MQTMWLLELPGMVLWTWCRWVGLCLVITCGLLAKAWRAVKPSLKPVLDIFHTINTHDVGIISVMEQFVMTMLMVCVLQWKMILSLWQKVTRPVHRQVEDALQYLQDLDDEVGVTGKARAVTSSKKGSIRSPKVSRPADKGHPIRQVQGHGQDDGEDQGVELD